MIKRFLLLLLTAPALLSAGLNENHDFQFWTKEKFEGDLGHDISVKLEAEFRFGDDVRKFYYQSTFLEAWYQPTHWLGFGFGDEEVYELSSSKKFCWKLDSRPTFEIGFRYHGDWRVEDINRLQRQFPQGDRPIWVYRNEFVLVTPSLFPCVEISPYLKNKFYETQFRGFNRDELYLGLRARLACHAEAEFFYLWRFDKKEDPKHWITIYAVGCELRFAF